MDGIRKISAFERSASFLHRRAMSRWRARSFADALPLMRRAAEAKPEDIRYHLDLMRLLTDMGREDEALKCLARACAFVTPSQEMLLNAAQCLKSLGREEDAHNALTAALRAQPFAESPREEIMDMLFSLGDAPMVGSAVSRRQARALMANRRAEQALEQGRVRASLRLTEISLSSFPSANGRLLRGRALLEAGDKEGAARQCRPLAFRPALPWAERLEAVNVMERAGRPLARLAFLQIIRQAPEMDWTGRALELGEMYLSKEALLKRLLPALERAPYHPRLLHACAVCLLRCGRPDAQARALWQRMLTVEPDNPLALRCLRLCQEDPRRAAALPLVFPAPKDARQKQPSPLMGLDAASPDLIPLCRQSLQEGADFQRAAELLAAHPSREAELILRALLLDPGLDRSARMIALGALTRRGVASPLPVLGLGSFFPDDPLAAPDERRVPLSVYLALKTALTSLGPLSPALWEDLMLTWSRLLPLRLPPSLKRDGKGMAAALAAMALDARGIPPPTRLLARRFGCSQRRINYCLNILRKRMGEDD